MRIFSSAIRMFVKGMCCVLSVLSVEIITLYNLKYPRRPPVDTGTKFGREDMSLTLN